MHENGVFLYIKFPSFHNSYKLMNYKQVVPLILKYTFSNSTVYPVDIISLKKSVSFTKKNNKWRDILPVLRNIYIFLQWLQNVFHKPYTNSTVFYCTMLWSNLRTL